MIAIFSLLFLANSSVNASNVKEDLPLLRDASYYESKFYDWLILHDKFPRDGRDFTHMLMNFARNDDYIETFNSEKHSFTLGHNQFSHLNTEEWREFLKLGMKSKPRFEEYSTYSFSTIDNLETEVDWVKNKAVSPVKDQGQCGSCWAFSAIGAIEGAYAIKKKKIKEFSPQQLVDCDNFFNGGKSLGCHGGQMDDAFKWIKNNNGVCSLEDYPYISGETKTASACNMECNPDKDSAPITYKNVKKNDDNEFMKALMHQPISVAIDASHKTFQFYKAGVYTGDCGNELNHGVLAVGYGEIDMHEDENIFKGLRGKDNEGMKYYKVKNSWGESWGMAGYVLMERNTTEKEGKCGILSGPPSFPVL